MKNKYSSKLRDAVPLPKSPQSIARSLVRHFYLDLNALLNKKDEGNFLRCIYCHYVFDDQKEKFEQLIKTLLSIGTFVDTATCIHILQGKIPLDQKYFHLSFDDGFRNNFLNAIPILGKLKVPAIFFVPSSLISAEWDRAYNYCLETMHYSGVIETLKRDDALKMIELGFEIGSHTKTHTRFSDISQDSILLEQEIKGSKDEIEYLTGVECKYISWPFGKLTDADDKSLYAVMKAGFTACFGAYRGSVVPGKTDLFSIPRHLFETQWPVSHTLYFLRGNMEVNH